MSRQRSIMELFGRGGGKGKGKGHNRDTGTSLHSSTRPPDGRPPAKGSGKAASEGPHPKRPKPDRDGTPHAPPTTHSPPRAQPPPPPPPLPAPPAEPQVSAEDSTDWNSHHVKLPCSSRYVYRSEGKTLSLWYRISDVLGTQISDANALREAIEAMNPHMDQSRWYFSALTHYFDHVMPPDQSALFFRRTLPEMQRLALRIAEICPTPIPLLETGRPGTVTLSQLQVCCLLCHGFFCTMPYRFWLPRARRPKDDDPDTEALLTRSFPSFNFLELYGPQVAGYHATLLYAPEEACPITDQQAAKFACLVHYFTQFFETHKQPDGTLSPGTTIEVTRKVTPEEAFPNWEKSTQCFPPVTCRTDGTIEDSPEPVAEVDFANKCIGGGVLGRGCVQEEIRFLLAPELLITRLLCETLDDNEAVEVRGTTRFSQHSGYGSTFRWAGPYDDKLPVSGTPPMRQSYILIMDAVNFRGGGLRPAHQYSPEYIQRELCKAYTAFSSLRPFPDTKLSVASGNWGCGVFGGDVQLKSLLQLIAAAQGGVPGLVYYCYGNAALAAALQRMVAALAKVPVGKMYTALCNYEQARHDAQRSSSADLAELYRADTLSGGELTLPVEAAVELAAATDTSVEPLATDSPAGTLEAAEAMEAPTVASTYDIFTHIQCTVLAQPVG
eukprot:EG_transcript_4759